MRFAFTPAVPGSVMFEAPKEAADRTLVAGMQRVRALPAEAATKKAKRPKK